MDTTTANDAAEEEEEKENVESAPAAKRRRIVAAASTPTNDIPEHFRHIRITPRKVKAGYYSTIVQLKTKYHCSDAQAVAGIVLTGQNLFNLPWKFFDTDDKIIDLDTAVRSRPRQALI